MQEEEYEDVPYLKPMRFLEFVMCVVCLVLFILFLESNQYFANVHVECFLYTTFLAFTVICIIDIISQIAGDPISFTPAFFVLFIAAGAFMASGIICIVKYNPEILEHGAYLVAIGIVAILTAVTFLLDVMFSCWYESE